MNRIKHNTVAVTSKNSKPSFFVHAEKPDLEGLTRRVCLFPLFENTKRALHLTQGNKQPGEYPHIAMPRRGSRSRPPLRSDAGRRCRRSRRKAGTRGRPRRRLPSASGTGPVARARDRARSGSARAGEPELEGRKTSEDRRQVIEERRVDLMRRDEWEEDRDVSRDPARRLGRCRALEPRLHRRRDLWHGDEECASQCSQRAPTASATKAMRTLAAVRARLTSMYGSYSS